MSSLRKDSCDWLVGPRISEILGAKFPTTRKVMQRFYHLHITESKTLREASKVVAQEVLEFWNRGCIPTIKYDQIYGKIEKYHSIRKNLIKSKHKTTPTHKKQRKDFEAVLDDVFVIAHAQALSKITIDEDKKFLTTLLETKTSPCLGSVDRTLLKKEERKRKREEAQEAYRNKVMNEETQSHKSESNSDLESESEESESLSGDGDSEYVPPTPKNKVKKDNIMTPNLCAVADRTKASDRSLSRVLIEAQKSVGVSPKSTACSYSQLRRNRIKNRRLFGDRRKHNIYADNMKLTVHFDGKRLSESFPENFVERIPVLLTGVNLCTLIGIPKTSEGTGKNIAELIYAEAEKEDILNLIVAISFDTTSTNTGCNNGAVKRFEKLLNRELLGLACRHHMRELIIGAVFETTFGQSNGPDVSLFKYLKRTWNTIDSNNLNCNIDVPEDVKCNVITFCKNQLKQFQPRGDYKEFLQLVIILASGGNSDNFHIKRPGASHHARWMSKVIYCLKLYLLRDELILLDTERDNLSRVCKFILSIYTEYWFLCQLATIAPKQDLDLLKKLKNYSSVDKDISEKTVSKHLGHLWYLSEKLICLSLFDSSISFEMKDLMRVEILNSKKPENKLKRVHMLENDILKSEIKDFITRGSVNFFHITGISTSFLNSNASTWSENSDYLIGLNIVKSFVVCNDVAERGVSLAQEFNNILTQDEEQKQLIFKEVFDHRQKYPTCKKSELC